MKRAILIFALSRSPWIGGIYYRKNIVNMMLTNERIWKKFRIVVLVNRSNSSVFLPFGDAIELICCPDGIGTARAMMKALICCLRYKVRYVFPLRPFRFLSLMGVVPVSWIADFQHCHYPEFFSEEENEKRNRDFRQMAEAKNPLVLSSHAALEDFRNFFAKERKNVFIVPFTSYIEVEKKALEEENETEILQKYFLDDVRYAVVCNQFWKHKNHITVLKAIKYLAKQNINFHTKVVFTGELSDRRNPEYINEVRMLMEDPIISEHVRLLGFINRMDQLCIMKHADYIIQPSLFEGWGTVVEDGKVLNKRILLSDIPVHREQMDENCILFEPTNPNSLAEAMLVMQESYKQPMHNVQDKTKEYGKKLEMIFQ